MLASDRPLALYVHFPWCARRCPYCDFNAHHQPQEIPYQTYVQALMHDLQHDLQTYDLNRPITSIFLGGGTPSLFEPAHLAPLFDTFETMLTCTANCEITLEANPGTLSAERVVGYHALGINRLSLGVQSFCNEALKRLGRIHNGDDARRAVEHALTTFDNCNIDIMYALPAQTAAAALSDLEITINYAPKHISWYQLTIEPNTPFYRAPPKQLPQHDDIDAIERAGYALLAAHQFNRYEVSAFAQSKWQSKHNACIWHYGDYLGIGAGAHSKLTLSPAKRIQRHWKHRTPRNYLDDNKPFTVRQQTVANNERVFEFMMNALRLKDGFSWLCFEQSVGQTRDAIAPILMQAAQDGLLVETPVGCRASETGYRFLNELVARFMPADNAAVN